MDHTNKFKTGLDTASLREIVERFRQIAVKDESASLLEADAYLDEIVDKIRLLSEARDIAPSPYEHEPNAHGDFLSAIGDSGKQFALKQRIEMLETLVFNLKRAFGRDGRSLFYLGETLDRALHQINSTDEHIRSISGFDASALKQEAESLAIRAQQSGLDSMLDEQEKSAFASSASVDKALRVVLEAEKMLEARGWLTAIYKDRIRRVRERAAWYRARKKLNEADVIAAGGNTNKAARLRNEARVLLYQDWAVVFPGEDAPILG